MSENILKFIPKGRWVLYSVEFLDSFLFFAIIFHPIYVSFYYFYTTHFLSFLKANMNVYIKISQRLNDYILLPFTYRITCLLCHISYEKAMTGKMIKFSSFYAISSHFEMFNELVSFLIIKWWKITNPANSALSHQFFSQWICSCALVSYYSIIKKHKLLKTGVNVNTIYIWTTKLLFNN